MSDDKIMIGEAGIERIGKFAVILSGDGGVIAVIPFRTGILNQKNGRRGMIIGEAVLRMIK